MILRADPDHPEAKALMGRTAQRSKVGSVRHEQGTTAADSPRSQLDSLVSRPKYGAKLPSSYPAVILRRCCPFRMFCRG